MNTKRKALFLDRDGVINVERNYVYRIEDFEFMPGIFDLCATASELGFRLIVITNQAGIARGYYTEADYRHLTSWMLEEFKTRGIEIDRVYYCPYHPTAGIGEYRRESFHRKPNPGMILEARDDFGLDLSRSILVGDKNTDIEAGAAAGVKINIKLAANGKYDPAGLEFPSLKAIREWMVLSLNDVNRDCERQVGAATENNPDKREKQR